jgi:integrase
MAAKLEKTKTPGIFKRGSRYVFIYRSNGKQKWESARTLEGARRAKAARVTDVGRGEFEERSRLPLREYAEAWIERYLGRGRGGFREGTRDEYRRQLEQYVYPYFAGAKLTEVTPGRVAEFVAWLCDEKAQGRRVADARRKAEAEKRGVPLSEVEREKDPRLALSDATIRNILAPLRACLASAVREGLIRSNPARDVDLPHRPTAEESEEEQVNAMTADELATLLALIPDRHRLLFRLLAATGLRISEAVALQWRHLELDGSSPHVKVRRALVKGRMGPPKSRHGRRQVPLDHELVKALRKAHKDTDWPGEEDLVFPAGNGKPLSQPNLYRDALKGPREEANLTWVGFHTFRHTCASMLFAEGRNAVQVQRWLGHHSPAFTLARYVHLLDGDLGEPLTLASPRGVSKTVSTPARSALPTG